MGCAALVGAAFDCELYETVCGLTEEYVAYEDCAFAVANNDEDKWACRTTHLANAQAGPEAADTHCPHARPVAVGPCVYDNPLVLTDDTVVDASSDGEGATTHCGAEDWRGLLVMSTIKFDTMTAWRRYQADAAFSGDCARCLRRELTEVAACLRPPE